jgi:hypothetical protein
MTAQVRIKLKSVGSLTKFGYGANKTAATRRAALLKAAKANGFSEVVRRLNVLYVWNKNKHPALAAKYKQDMHWLQKRRDER